MQKSDTEQLQNQLGLNALAIKNFRQQADIEAFYRFVYENDLRSEALEIFNETLSQKKLAKQVKAQKKQ